MAAAGLILRELRGRGRWPSTYVWRAAYGLLLGATLVIAVATSGSYGPDQAANVGISIFLTFAVTQLLFGGLWALVAGAGSIVREKTGGTLGLLLISGMRPAGIVAMKFVAIFSLLLLLLAGGAPLLFVTTGLGGVAYDQVFAVLLITLSLVFFLLALGLFSSAVRLQEEQAFVTAFVLALFWLLLLPMMLGLVDSLLRFRSWGGGGMPSLTVFGYLAQLIFPPMAFLDLFGGIPGGGVSWIGHVVTNFLAGGGLLALGALLLPRFVHPSPKISAGKRLRRALGLPRLPVLRRSRLHRLGVNPVYWREAAVVLGNRTMRWIKPICLALILGMWLLTLILSERRWWSWRERWELLAGIGLAVCGLVGSLILLGAGARAFTPEQTDRVGGLLKATLLSPAQIVLGKLAGILRGLHFFLVGTAFFFYWLLYLGNDLHHEEATVGAPILVGSIVLFSLALSATCSLFTRKSALAFATAIGIGIAWSYLIGIFSSVIMFRYYWRYSRMDELTFMLILAAIHLAVAVGLVPLMIRALPRRLAEN